MTLGLRERQQRPVSPARSDDANTRSIPFDQTFKIKLEGIPNKVQRSSAVVSIEAAFTAVSIGYGVVEEVTPINFGPPVSSNAKSFDQITIGELAVEAERVAASAPDVPRDVPALEAVFRAGFRLNPAYLTRALLAGGQSTIEPSSRDRLFQLASTPSRKAQFLYAFFDDGSGREFQSEPVLNIAGLGSSEGKRPFRYFPKPLTFQPRSAIRLEVTEISDFKGELHLCLHGFKMLGGAETPTSALRNRRRGR